MPMLNGPTDEQMENIKTELNENNERFEHNLELLRNWITYQDHLPKNYDTRILPIFLRGCKHDLERTKRKIEVYYSVRKTIPELYANRNTLSSDAITATKTVACVPMPDLNHDGCRVCIIKVSSNDSSEFSTDHIVRMFCMIGDIRVTEECPLAGDIFVLDGGYNLTAPILARTIAGATIIGKGMAVAHEAYPQRLKAMHVVNMPEYAEKFLVFLKSFMKEKLRNRFVVHKQPEGILEYITPEILPKEYGGTAGEFNQHHEKWMKYIQDKNEWFQEQEKVVASGPVPKHLSHSCAFDSNESIHGSFRKLAID